MVAMARPSSAAGSVSFTSTIESDGMTRMKPRKSRKKNAKLPMTIIESVAEGT